MNLLQKYKSFSINYNYLEKKYNFASKLPLIFKLCLHLKDFHALMRMSKNRCQLMLLKFASSELVWIRPDLNQLHQEWSLGLHGFPDEYARHIPLYILQQGLSEELLEAWDIK